MSIEAGWSSSLDSKGAQKAVKESQRQDKGTSDKGSRFKKAASSSGAILSEYGEASSRNAAQMGSNVGKVEYHRGGKVRKTGVAIVKRGERVIPSGKRKKVERQMKRKGMNLTNKNRSKKRSPRR